jgi:hypothetical protein
MKHFYLVIAFYFISSVPVFSKTATVKATVVSIPNDTTSVYIIDKKPKITPLVFLAAQTPEGKPTIELRPATVSEIRIDSGDYYIRAIVHIDMIYSMSTNINKVYSTDSSNIDTVFFRVLVQGPLELYLYTDINSKDHFFIKDFANSYTELIDKNVPIQYLHLESSLDYLVHISNFKEQLRVLMKDCPSVASKIPSIDFKEQQLIKLFLAYANCIKEEIRYLTPVKSATTKFAVVAGVSITKIQFIGQEISTAVHLSSYLHLSSFPVSTDPVIGLSAVIPLNRTNDKLNFNSSLLWWGYDTKSNYTNEYQNEYFVHFKTDYVKIVLGPSIKFNVGRLKLFGSIGLIGMCLVNIVNERHVEYGPSTAQPTLPTAADGVAFYHPAYADAGFYGSMGLLFSRFSLEARYNRSKGIATGTDLKTPVTSLEFLLSYNLVK